MTPKEITQFYNKYKKRLYNISVRILGDGMEAEEVVHDVIVKFLRRDFSRVSKCEQEGWLCKSCVRGSIDVLRRRNSQKRLLDSLEYEIEEEVVDCEKRWNDIIVKAEKKRLIALIDSGIRCLPDGYRTVLSLHLFEGYDYMEIASILGVEESSVRSQYLRGKRKLLKFIEGSNGM